MKTWLLPLALIVILPIPTTLTLNHKNVTQQTTFTKTLNNDNNLSLSNDNNNSGYDWNSVQNSINNKLNSSIIKTKLTPEQLNALKLKSNNFTNQFNTNNTTKKQSMNFFQEKNSQFKNVYNNNQNGFSTIKNKINAQYFGLQKVDLDLTGGNTYSDAINNLNIAINSSYPDNNIIVSLVDKTLANKYLFDDSTTTSLSDFINNNISIKVNVQFNNHLETKVINLTNIKIDSIKEDSWLYECIKFYFTADNKQDLYLNARNTKIDALNNVIKKINTRFNINIGQDINNHSGIQILMVNANSDKDNFLKKENALLAMNQNMNFDVNIYDYNSPNVKKSAEALYLININFNSNDMKQVINTLWLNNTSQDNPIDLQITSDETYQQVVDNFNQRLENLNQKDHFEIQLTNQSFKNKKLDDDYNPVTGIFKANIQFSYIDDNERKILNNNNINTTDLYLSHVTLSKWAQNTKIKFDSAVNNISKLLTVSAYLSGVSITSAVLAGVCWLTGNPYAGALTILSAATGIAAAIISLRVSNLQNVIEQLSISATLTISNVLTIVNSVFTFIYYAMIALDSIIETDWEAAVWFFSITSIIAATINVLHNWINN